MVRDIKRGEKGGGVMPEEITGRFIGKRRVGREGHGWRVTNQFDEHPRKGAMVLRAADETVAIKHNQLEDERRGKLRDASWVEGGQRDIRGSETFRQCNSTAEQVGRDGRPDRGAGNMGVILVDEQAERGRDINKQV